MKGKVIFIGAGPGDPDLVTVKGRNVIEKADVIVYAGSLVNKEVLNPRKEDCVVYNSAVLNLEETTEICREATSKGQLVARVHTGDPSIYGAIGEQIRELQKYDIEYDIISCIHRDSYDERQERTGEDTAFKCTASKGK